MSKEASSVDLERSVDSSSALYDPSDLAEDATPKSDDTLINTDRIQDALRFRKRRIILIILSAVLILSLGWKSWRTQQPKRPRYAFATYVSGFNATDYKQYYEGANDQYFDGARVINYQLKHSPSTRGDADSIILVSKQVTKEAREQLTREGARVIVSEDITPHWIVNWMNASPFSHGFERWHTVMDKITLANLVEYEKVCFLDSDTLVLHPLAGVFDDPATAIIPSKKILAKDEAVEVPEEYMFAAAMDRGMAQIYNKNELNFDYFYAGFFCLHPSHEIYQYYTTWMNREQSFDPQFPEQSMVRDMYEYFSQKLNKLHRQNGSMPFGRLGAKWNAHGPNELDLFKGISTFHGKVWLPNFQLNTVYPELHRIWWYQKHEMEAYYTSLGIQSEQATTLSPFPEEVPKKVLKKIDQKFTLDPSSMLGHYDDEDGNKKLAGQATGSKDDKDEIDGEEQNFAGEPPEENEIWEEARTSGAIARHRRGAWSTGSSGKR